MRERKKGTKWERGGAGNEGKLRGVERGNEEEGRHGRGNGG